MVTYHNFVMIHENKVKVFSSMCSAEEKIFEENSSKLIPIITTTISCGMKMMWGQWDVEAIDNDGSSFGEGNLRDFEIQMDAGGDEIVRITPVISLKQFKMILLNIVVKLSL